MDPDPHIFSNLDPHPDPYQGNKSNPDCIKVMRIHNTPVKSCNFVIWL
jgi:hypothetical protein